MPVKVGIFGGSFDPPHEGHQRCIQYALARGHRCDKVFVIPSGNRQDKPDQTSYPNRLRMAQLAFQAVPKVFIGQWEDPALNPEPVYTYNTVLLLKRLYPTWDFHLVIGQDNKIENWYKSEELRQELAGLIVVPRDNISSTKIRANVKRGAPILPVDPLVDHYIQEHKLYGYGSKTGR